MCRNNHTNIIVQKYNTSIIYDNIITNRLKEQLQEGATEGPYQACIKFSDVQAMVQKHFSTVNTTAQETSKILHQAFPRATSGRSTVVFGVRRQLSTSDSDSGTPIISTPSSATFHVPTRQAHIEEELCTMQSQNAALKERVAQLEMQNACLQGVASPGTISLSILNSQIRNLTSPSTLLSHGPIHLNGLRSSHSMP